MALHKGSKSNPLKGFFKCISNTIIQNTFSKELLSTSHSQIKQFSLISIPLLLILGSTLSVFNSKITNNTITSADFKTPKKQTFHSGSSAGSSSTGIMNNTATLTFSHTVNSGHNRLLVVGVSAESSTASVSTMTYNGIALTRLGNYPNTGNQTRVEIWYLVAPPIGTYDVVLTNSVNDYAIVGAQNFSFVDQTTPFEDYGYAVASGGAGSVTIERNTTSSNGNTVFGIVAFNNGDFSLDPAYNESESWDQTVNGSIAGAAGVLSGGASVDMGWTSTASDRIITTVSIRASSLEICSNGSDDNGDGRTDEVYPGGVQSDLQLWLKGEVGTNTTTTGQNVTSWADQSANAYSANADVNATDYPTFTNNAINFNPGIEFDGDYTDDYSDGLHLGGDYIYANKEGLHVFMVMDPNVDAETDNHCFDFGLAANGGYGMIYSNNDYGMYTNNGHGGINTELIHTEGDAPTLAEFQADFDDFQAFFRNGVELANIPVTISSLGDNRVNEADSYQLGGSTGPVSIGRKSASIYLSNNGGRMFDGHISEVIVYTDSLTSEEREQVNSYLAIKYGITLNHNYSSSTGSVKKDVTDGYANIIAGIGLDNCSGLNQKQSKSAEEEAIVTVALGGSIAATNAANASTFSSDGTFLIWGNDGTAANVTWNNTNVTIAGGTYSRVDRVWRFSEHFDVTNIALRVDVDDSDFDLPAMPGTANGNYYLLIDDDGDFTNGGTTSSIMSLASGSDWDVLIPDVSASYFSFGINDTPLEICNNGSDDDGDGLTDCIPGFEDPDCSCCGAKAPVLNKL